MYPTIYNKLIYMYLKNTYKDELGEEVLHSFSNSYNETANRYANRK
jgi:penicillin amidase